MNYLDLIKNYTYKHLSGRYIPLEKIDPFLSILNGNFKVETKGFSVENRAIKTIEWGVGKKKILMWSQMHGNESTTTKALIDFLHLLNQQKETFVAEWYNEFTFLIVPILNPDGAFKYTRVNANQVDLNRDSVNLTQLESKLLRKLFDEFNPDYAFNLHDQRTIFGVGNSEKPATISFLAPAFDEMRSLNQCREKAIRLIVSMNKEIQKVIPGQVGRFDDEFNINCIGDYFQFRNVPTILFEAGHYPEDYEREKTREIVFLSYLVILDSIKEQKYLKNDIIDYMEIPENCKSYNDIALRDVIEPQTGERYIVKAQYLEVLEGEEVKFYPVIVEIEEKETNFAHLALAEQYVFLNSLSIKEDKIGKKLEEVVDLSNIGVNYLLKK